MSLVQQFGPVSKATSRVPGGDTGYLSVQPPWVLSAPAGMMGLLRYWPPSG